MIPPPKCQKDTKLAVELGWIDGAKYYNLRLVLYELSGQAGCIALKKTKQPLKH